MRKRKLFDDELDFDFLLLPVLQFALTNLLEWATIKRVSKVFKRCGRWLSSVSTARFYVMIKLHSQRCCVGSLTILELLSRRVSRITYREAKFYSNDSERKQLKLLSLSVSLPHSLSPSLLLLNNKLMPRVRF